MKQNITSPKTLLTGLIVILFVFASSIQAEDWPHWLGPNGDNQIAPAKDFDPDLNNWKIAWQKDVGLGYSTITSANGRAYTMGHDGESTETILCFDAATGNKIWDYSYQGQLLPNMHVGGPNASVTVGGDHIFAVSKDGQVFCLKADSGKKVWSSNLTEVLAMELSDWGFGSSPVEYKDNIIICAGKTVALDKTTGHVNWVSDKDYQTGFGTPVVFTNNGKDYIASHNSGLSVLDASNGTEVVHQEMKTKYGGIAATPLVVNQGKHIFTISDIQSELFLFD